MLKKIKKYLFNTLWIMGDKITNLLVGFGVTVIVARHLGPEDFGVFSYSISLVALFSAAGHMGLSGLVIREFVKKPDTIGETIGTALWLKLIGVSIGYIALLGYAFFYEGSDSLGFLMLAIAGASMLFSPFDVIDYWFQSILQAKYIAYSRVAGLILSSLLKISFVFLGLGVIYFVIAHFLQAVFIAVGFLIAYLIKSNLSIKSWRFNFSTAKNLLSQGWLIYLGAMFAVINLKVDQVMLRWLDGAESVGIYAVAAQLSEAWYFVPIAIVSSFFPKLIRLREENPEQYKLRLQQLFDFLFVLAVIVAIAMSVMAEWIVKTFFGLSYLESSSVLIIHTWAGIFIFLRAALSRWILIENALIFSLLTQGMGAVVNVVLNYFFIPLYGVEGAAYTTLVSYAFSSFISLCIYSKTRPIFFMMMRSFFSFIRYTKIESFK